MVIRTMTVIRIIELANAFQSFVPASADCSWNGVYTLSQEKVSYGRLEYEIESSFQ